MICKKTEGENVSRKTWTEFRSCGLLWFVNMILHTFGWAIVMEMDSDENGKSKVTDVYPARVGFRGFNEKSNSVGYSQLSEYLKDNASDLAEEASDM